MTWPRRLATTAAILTVTVLVLGGALTVLAPTRASLVALAVAVAVSPLSVALGVVIARGSRGPVVGALLAMVGLTAAMTATREVAWQAVADRPDAAASLSWLVAGTAEGAWWVLVSVALLLLHFPDGRLPGPRWRWVPVALVTCALLNQVHGAIEQVPFRPPLAGLDRPFPAPPGWVDALSLVPFVLMLLLFVACAVSLGRRFRRGDRVLRRQVTWLAVGGFGLVMYPFLCLLEIVVWGQPSWMSGTVAVTALVGIPVAVAVAVQRHDVYDVDTAFAAAVTWGLVTFVLLAVFVTSSLGAGLLLGRDSSLASAIATAACALVLSPLRGRLQRLVDRRFYPLRGAAVAAIERLHRDISEGTARPEALEGVLREALRDPALRVGFRLSGADGFVDAQSDPVPDAAGEPVLLDGSQVGVIVPGGGHGEASVELVRVVAGRAATIVEMVRLRLELAGTLREVELSRARLVQSGYDERRRLERDLHDGAQQRLVSLGMALRVAQRHLDDGSVDVNDLLDQSVAELGTAVAELRQLAHGIRPSSLDDGLPAAVARLVRTVPVTVELDVDSGELPDDVATTAYFVISESLANAVKHSQASHIGLSVARRSGEVVVRVTDDGRGGAVLRPESGLADRVAALGGSVDVVSRNGHGTVVEAVMPCAS